MYEASRASRVAHKRDRLWIRFPNEEMKYFIFSFRRSDNEAERGVEFRHSTRNASRIRWKVGNGCVLMGMECFNTRFPCSLCLLRYVQDTA